MVRSCSVTGATQTRTGGDGGGGTESQAVPAADNKGVVTKPSGGTGRREKPSTRSARRRAAQARRIALAVFTGKIAGSEERVGLAVRSAASYITLNNRQHVAYGVRRQSAGSRFPIAVLIVAVKNSLPSKSKARHANVVKWAELTRCLRKHQLGGGRAGQESSMGVHLGGGSEAESTVPNGKL
jgi:hypothetical protein